MSRLRKIRAVAAAAVVTVALGRAARRRRAAATPADAASSRSAGRRTAAAPAPKRPPAAPRPRRRRPKRSSTAKPAVAARESPASPRTRTLAPRSDPPPDEPAGPGGVTAEGGRRPKGEEEAPKRKPNGSRRSGRTGGAEAGIAPAAPTFEIPSIPSSSCAASGVPAGPDPDLPARRRRLRPRPAGRRRCWPGSTRSRPPSAPTSTSPRPARWAGCSSCPRPGKPTESTPTATASRDPYNPEDAIFAAARYLSAAGMPADTYGAIFSYNHADWYVAEVLANAACYAAEVGGAAVAAARPRRPQLQVLELQPGAGLARAIPAEYLAAFEDAAARYELGQRGVWALAAVARLESNFGRGMGKKQMRKRGPLGLDASEWATYAVDGDEDGHIRHADPADSAATLARLIWSRGSLRAGIFTHNQAEWYVQAVLAEAEADRRRLQGHATSTGASRRSAAGARNRPARARSCSRTASPAPRPTRRPRSRRRSRPPTRSPPPPTSGAAATAPGTPTATTAPARSASPSTAPACSTPPLDLRLAGEHGEPGPASWITIYASADPHLRGDRRPALGHGRRRRRHRPALAPEPPYPKASSSGTRRLLAAGIAVSA